MSPGPIAAARADLGFPRVSGDEPEQTSTWDSYAAFSPRERG